MSRHLSIATIIEKNRIASEVAFVILLDVNIVDPNTRAIVETLHLARNDENIAFGGNLYLAANFVIEIDQTQGEEPTVTVTAVDPTRTIASRLEAYAGGMYSSVRMTVVNTSRLDKPAELTQDFEITGATTEENSYTSTITLGSENPFQIRFPLHAQFRDRCCWRFKSKQCGYTGAATKCSYTLEGADGCRTKGNNLNFGGEPGLVLLNV